jgi:hypothetical protein
MLELDPEPADALDRLHETSPRVAERVERWLDRIEDDPGSAAVRRRQIRPAGLWLITVPSSPGEDEFAILWEMDGDTPVVRYLGPSSFS